MSPKKDQTEWFIRTLVEGDLLLETNAIIQLSQQLEIKFEDKRLFCIAVRYKAYEAYQCNANMMTKLYNACVNACKSINTGINCYIGRQLYVVMVVFDDGKKAAKVENLRENIVRQCGKQVQFGVGRSYADLEKLTYSRVEAYEALANIVENDEISYIDDLYATRSITTRKLEREKNKVLEQFKSGNLSCAMESMTQLVEKVRKESPVREGKPYPTSIRRTVVELLVEIMHISADAGVDVDEVLNHQDPYRRVFELRSTPDILSWFSEVIHILHSKVIEQNCRLESNMLILAKKCIEEHIFNPELSLSLVSEQLGITPTYFSSFFIREMRVGFNEYITSIRIDRAKKLLTETNKKISDIALECGFRSASYFIVVFRKQTGISPGEYRNMKK